MAPPERKGAPWLAEGWGGRQPLREDQALTSPRAKIDETYSSTFWAEISS